MPYVRGMYTGEHLTGLMEKNGLSWYSYQEDIDLAGPHKEFDGVFGRTNVVSNNSKPQK
ncbi:MAG: hypothetical protein JOZ31_10280 [Verrucomicrobia bacterium]|nr:hypothetical protein [Verrucomicrobiota bacterium]MBV8483004.1 hypothetical protein [Verrucomicrobiota bacterium]